MTTDETPCDGPAKLVCTDVAIRIGRQADGTLATEIRFANGTVLTDERDLGLSDTEHALHDVAHCLLALTAGLSRSPVLERVTEARSLTQRDVDLEEAAAFAVQAWCASLSGGDPDPTLAMVRVSLDRLAENPEPEDEDFTRPVLITGVRSDHGTVVRFTGLLEDGTEVTADFDHRPAQSIVTAMHEAGGPVTVHVEPWQIKAWAA